MLLNYAPSNTSTGIPLRCELIQGSSRGWPQSCQNVESGLLCERSTSASFAKMTAEAPASLWTVSEGASAALDPSWPTSMAGLATRPERLMKAVLHLLLEMACRHGCIAHTMHTHYEDRSTGKTVQFPMVSQYSRDQYYVQKLQKVMSIEM